ncbi:dihydrolipoyl dehydrogenase [Lysobacter sp. SG-8]|uniref:Dihydrolipoyl dehydrogenase n=1 Tax=Marilutibacter penaei TaxID=2759900 RepID=A0A7W3U4H6_9GAMM|nr:dihydrolipoyl dehydrogenase [Lysobacter penaei]MBB1088749.1 dihydrolipoyl dehydrogenase [Lysobacter penaei]
MPVEARSDIPVPLPDEVDVAIIGAGTAGMAAYRQVRKHTDRVALIEGGPFGTTCARVGCMPSKLLIAPAEARHRLAVLPAFGIHSDAGTVDGRAVMQRVRDERDRFVGFVQAAVEGFDPAHVIRARARFEDPHTLRLQLPGNGTGGAVARLRAGRIVIATGSRPAVPDMLRAAGDRLLTSDDIFDWDTLPGSVAVFGAGVIGLELGQALHRLGVRVRLFGRGGELAGISDPAVRERAVGILSDDLPMSLDARDVTVSRDGDAVAVRFRDPGTGPCNEPFEWVLATTGRRPNVDDLGLEHAGLERDGRGVPVFDRHSLRAGDSHVFVAGDANDDLPLLHEAADEGRIAGENAARFPEVLRQDRRTPLGIVFCDPQIAFVGQRHAALEQAGVEFEVGEVAFEDQGRARVMQVNHGLLRVYGERESGLLLGAEMIGPAGEHLAHLLAWAIQARLTVGQVLEMPFYHPVIEEGVRTALRLLNEALGMGPHPPPRCIDCGPGA